MIGAKNLSDQRAPRDTDHVTCVSVKKSSQLANEPATGSMSNASESAHLGTCIFIVHSGELLQLSFCQVSVRAQMRSLRR